MTGEDSYRITPAICTRVAIMVRLFLRGRRRLTDFYSVKYTSRSLEVTSGIKLTKPSAQSSQCQKERDSGISFYLSPPASSHCIL